MIHGDALVSQPRDQHRRPLRDLRISVMDRCNFRCPYCMPEATYGEHFTFLTSEQRLDFDEIERLCRLAAQLGVSKLRLTGGEPLLRPNLAELVGRLHRIPGITDLAITTNGALLARQARELREAGLDRVTISLDTLDPVLFQRMAGGRGKLDDVLAGIEAARAEGFPKGLKINTVVQRGVNESSVIELVEHFRGTGIVVRFIEYMDVGNRNHWDTSQVVPSRELLQNIHGRWPLEALPSKYPGEVATRYRFVDGEGEIGVISSISQPFCGGCTRARLSSDGVLYTCLFATQGKDLRALLRSGSTDEALLEVLQKVWRERTDRYSEERGKKRSQENHKIEMYYIGG
ncbi:GTP 3',8-cyclase MoaA [Dyella koreensis]|uniref:GTP 3',8-cyclase n=1 Tax=Dyella koreensis TaxID=311235 RepID=A0ABW8KAB6_9GAMM